MHNTNELIGRIVGHLTRLSCAALVALLDGLEDPADALPHRPLEPDLRLCRELDPEFPPMLAHRP